MNELDEQRSKKTLDFMNIIEKNLIDNGFPQKNVSLPLEKVYEAADNRGISFNTVRDRLKVEKSIDLELNEEKILFFPVKIENSFSPEMLKKATEFLDKMSPEQKNSILDKISKMSDAEKADILEQGKKMGVL